MLCLILDSSLESVVGYRRGIACKGAWDSSRLLHPRAKWVTRLGGFVQMISEELVFDRAPLRHSGLIFILGICWQEQANVRGGIWRMR